MVILVLFSIITTTINHNYVYELDIVYIQSNYALWF